MGKSSPCVPKKTIDLLSHCVVHCGPVETKTPEDAVTQTATKLAPDVLIVDGNHMLHRVLHLSNFADLEAEDGTPTGGVFGAILTIRKALTVFPTARRCTVVWDGRRSARRKALCPTYKESRDLTPDDRGYQKWMEHRELFDDQRPRLAAILPDLGIRQIQLENREADDVIWYLTRWTLEEGRSSVVVTEDSDLLQVVTDAEVGVYRPREDETITLDNFRAQTGVSRTLYVLRRCFLGKDDVPGVKGVGKKTANRFLARLDERIDRLPTNLDEWREVLTRIPDTVEDVAAEDTRNGFRYRKLLPEEVVGDIARNIAVFDLHFEELTEAEQDYLVRSVSYPASFNESELLEHCSTYDFGSVIESWSGWTEPFRRLS